MVTHLLQRKAFEAGEVRALREALLSSPLVARSTLGGSFRQSRGFALTFTREGLPALASRFPEASRFVERVLGDASGRAGVPLWRRGRVEGGRANAFYLNLLLVADGGSVGRHVDATLRGPAEEGTAVPQRVSVLYLAVPSGAKGGELRLYERDVRCARVRPREGDLLHFRGDLAHEVTLLAGAESPRASLVLEQYALGEAALARLRPLHVQSKAGFGAYLDSHARPAAG